MFDHPKTLINLIGCSHIFGGRLYNNLPPSALGGNKFQLRKFRFTSKLYITQNSL